MDVKIISHFDAAPHHLAEHPQSPSSDPGQNERWNFPWCEVFLKWNSSLAAPFSPPSPLIANSCRVRPVLAADYSGSCSVACPIQPTVMNRVVGFYKRAGQRVLFR